MIFDVDVDISCLPFQPPDPEFTADEVHGDYEHLPEELDQDLRTERS